MKYFVTVSIRVQPRNSVQSYVHAKITVAWNHQITDDPAGVLADVEEYIRQGNLRYSKCTPLHTSSYPLTGVRTIIYVSADNDQAQFMTINMADVRGEKLKGGGVA